MPSRLPPSLLSALADLARWLKSEQIPAVVIGGVAASVLGRPRLTQDIDALAVLPEEEWTRAVNGAATFGIVPRITEALAFARQSRVLLLRHTPSGIDLDITRSPDALRTLRISEGCSPLTPERIRPAPVAGSGNLR